MCSKAATPPGGEKWFEKLHPLLLSLRKACAINPGIVLADQNASHFIRYYTQCSVIANNFLLTDQHFKKINLIDQLFALAPEKLHEKAPYVKYVIARPGDIKSLKAGEFTYQYFVGVRDPRLTKALLFNNPETLPSVFELIDKSDITVSMPTPLTLPYARLYRIRTKAAR